MKKVVIVFVFLLLISSASVMAQEKTIFDKIYSFFFGDGEEVRFAPEDCVQEEIIARYSYTPIRVWPDNPNMITTPGSTINFNSIQALDGGGSMLVYTAGANSNPGFLLHEDSHPTDSESSVYEGISFWVKGDGSDGTGTLRLHTSDYEFSLSDDTWHKIYTRWSDFSPIPDCNNCYLFFKVYNNNEEGYFFFDRPMSYSNQVDCIVEDINPLTTLDSGPQNILQYTEGMNYVSNTIAKMQNQEDTRIIVMGDSITVGSQIWYLGDMPTQESYMLNSVLEVKLRNHFGYSSIDIDTYAQGGEQSGWGLQNINNVIDMNPDMVVWYFGANDCDFGSVQTYDTNTRAAIDALQAANIEVIINVIIPVIATPRCTFEVHEQFMQAAHQIAEDKNIGLVDLGAIFLSRGTVSVGDLYSDRYHPNHRGHEYIARGMYSGLTNQDVQVWDNLPSFLYDLQSCEAMGGNYCSDPLEDCVGGDGFQNSEEGPRCCVGGKCIRGPEISLVECYFNGGWNVCDDIPYASTIEEVHATCIDDVGVQDVSFVLHNQPDGTNLISGLGSGGPVYTLDVNPEVVITDSGDFTFTATCTDIQGASIDYEKQWSLDWGTLNVEVVSVV